jgi:hypothetical protein
MTDATAGVIAGLGSAPAWPLSVDAQQGDRVARIGVLMGAANDAEERTVLQSWYQRISPR